MSEEKQVKKQLRKNMLLNLIAFSIIFTILGVIIYSQFANSLYKSADEELNRSLNQTYMKFDKYGSEQKNNIKEPINEQQINQINFKNIEPPQEIGKPEENEFKREGIDSLRVIKITRNSDGSISQVNSINDNVSTIFSNAEFDKDKLNIIYETTVQGYTYRAINYKNEDETYTQIFINIDSEKDIAEKFITNLIVSFSISVVIILIASYILSKRTLKPIVESWKKQTQFVQDASHELRTPLTIIKAKQEALLEKPETKIIDNVEDISITLQETQRLTKLIKELMELAKNDSDKIVLNKESFNLDDELSALINLYKDVAESQEKQMKLDLQFNDNVNADLNKIKELMVILLDNSLKYTEEKDTIEVKTYKKDSKCVIEVIDTGIGISKEAIDHIFERFYREEKSRTRQKGGMGLGLSIAYNIVMLHKGSIKYDKNIEKGTRVVVKLPIK